VQRVRLTHPAPGFDIGSRFGDRPDPFNPRKRNFHNGVDIKTPFGTMLVAPSSGVVRFAGFLPSSPASGLALGVDAADGRTFWSFAHLAEIFVSSGEFIEEGQLVALSGDSGTKADGSPSVTGPHLHFRVDVDGRTVDPAPLIGESTGGAVKMVAAAGVLVAIATLVERTLRARAKERGR
jgi:murein DD-endopeptidase MepM/ murein hydrolase activator NlpD